MKNTAVLPATLCYYEIPAPDLEAAGGFYRAAFGWNIEPSGHYLTCCAPDGTLQCGLDPTGQPAGDSGVLIYLKVADVPAALEAVRAAGGAVVQGKTMVGSDPQWGYTAIFRDPNGNKIGLWCKT